MTPLHLSYVDDESRFGGKAAQLGAAIRAGFPVPLGHALPVELVDAIATGDANARGICARSLERTADVRVAVRSSAVGEDSADASFAGQHLTRLNVRGLDALFDAVADVWRSGRTDAALAYRARLGIAAPPRLAVVVQEMVDAECAGVMFTRNPIDGSDERVIEAAWGLGEAVVAGLVEPDRWRMARGGEVLEEVVGEKDVAIRVGAAGDTEEVAVPDRLRRVACLDARRLRMLDELAARCESHFDGAHDIEWAFAGERLFLLQRRPITR